MPHRQLYLKMAKKLSLANDQLVLSKDNGEQVTFPLEDFDLIFVEDPNSVITINLLSKMAELGCSMIVCGKDYLPKAQVLPFNTYYLQSQIVNLQLNLLPSKKKKLWEMIVRQKIKNQLTILETASANQKSIAQVKIFLDSIKPGDESNMEGAAARVYFQALFGNDFIRFSDTLVSSSLNYGYSIIASQVIRTVAFNGLLDNLGIWHASNSNNNNLSYDLIEPYRQVVDLFVYKNVIDLSNPLSHEIKIGLINLLNKKVVIDNNSYKISYAIGITVNSFVQYMKSGDIKDIKLPVFDVSEENEPEL